MMVREIYTYRQSLANEVSPDGTLLQRSLRTIRTRTVVRVNVQGDTIVRTIREPIVDVTRYRGDWEINGSRWRLNTPEGIALIGSAANDGGTGSGTGSAATFSHLWYVRDRLGSVRSVVDATGTILQNTAYYASGVPVQCFGTQRVTDRGHIGNRYLDFAAIGWYDNTARMHDALLCRFTSRDPLAPDYPALSPYTHCGANPLRYIDPDGKRIFLSSKMNIEQVFAVMYDLQKLTDDKIVFSTQKDGTRMVKIAHLEEGNHPAGTNLIRQLNTSSRKVTIEYNKSIGDGISSNRFNHLSDNESNSENGVGSNSAINFAPDHKPKIEVITSRGKHILDKAKSFICLAHELIHALHSIKGDMNRTNTPAYKYEFKNFIITQGKANMEELRTTGINYTYPGDITENDIRKEQNQGVRVVY